MEIKKSYTINEVSKYLDKIIIKESEILKKNLKKKRKDFISNDELQYV